MAVVLLMELRLMDRMVVGDGDLDQITHSVSGAMISKKETHGWASIFLLEVLELRKADCTVFVRNREQNLHIKSRTTPEVSPHHTHTKKGRSKIACYGV